MHTRDFSVPFNTSARKALTFSLCAAALLLVGCNSSSPVPGASEGRRIIEERIKKEANGLITLVSFEKTNGMETDVMGVKGYKLEYKAVLAFSDDCTWGGNALGWDGSFTARRGRRQLGVLDGLAFNNNGKKGENYAFTSSLELQRTERGWREAKQ